MNTDDAKATDFSSGEEDLPLYFSEWLKRRRQELDLTQEQLAQRASCSVFAIRKMESGERRPSRQLAELLAKALEIPAENQPIFIQVARGERSVECLHAILPGRASLPAGEPRPATGNLPRSLTPFIGRAAINGILERTILVIFDNRLSSTLSFSVSQPQSDLAGVVQIWYMCINQTAALDPLNRA